MPRGSDWFRTIYILVRSAFVLLDGELHRPSAIRRGIRDGDERALRGLRQKEVEMVLLRASKASPHIEAMLIPWGLAFRLNSVPDLEDLVAPVGVPAHVRDDARFEAMMDSWTAAKRVIDEGGDAEAALRAFNGMFPHETKAMRRLGGALKDYILRVAKQVEEDAAFAEALAHEVRLLPTIDLPPGASPGVRAHAAFKTVVEHRALIAQAAARIEAALG